MIEFLIILALVLWLLYKVFGSKEYLEVDDLENYNDEITTTTVDLTVKLDIEDDNDLKEAKERLKRLEQFKDKVSERNSKETLKNAIALQKEAIENYENGVDGEYSHFTFGSDLDEFFETKVPFEKTLEIAYQDAEGNLTTRIVDFKEIDHGYLAGFCHLKNAKRTFRLDRIVKFTDTETGEVINDIKKYVSDILDKKNK